MGPSDSFLFSHHCVSFVGTTAIQLPAGPVPEEKEPGEISVATAGTCHSGPSSKDQDNSRRARSGLKRKKSKSSPERGMYKS